MNYQAYSTGFQLAYLHNMLPKEQKKLVPRSTGYEWGNKNYSNQLGFLDYDEGIDRVKLMCQNNKLGNIAWAFFSYMVICKNIINELPDRMKRMHKYRYSIIKLAEKMKHYFPAKKIANTIGISHHTLSRWKSEHFCRMSLVEKCRKIHPNQLSLKEIEIIQEYLERYSTWSLSSIYLKTIREARIYIHLNTFYKYAGLLGFKRKKKQKKHKNNTGISATRPGEIIQMDITEIRLCNGLKIYIHIVIDNFSRKILACKAGLKKDAVLAKENFTEAIKEIRRNNYREDFLLITDDGSENKGEMQQCLNGYSGINHVIAQTDIDYSNSMVESVIRDLKQSYLYYQNFTTVTDFRKYLPLIMHDFNEEKPLMALKGHTPNEVFSQREFCPIIAPNTKLEAILQRIEDNKTGNCW